MESKIYEAISNTMSEIGAVGKNDTNRQQGFKYRGIDAVMNALSPAMIKNRVFCVPEVMEQTREEHMSKNGCSLIYSICKVRYKFYTVDGSSVEAVVIGEGMDSGDKATSKALSNAFKYACFQIFCISTEEMKNIADPNIPENQKISANRVKTLISRCKTDNVDENVILDYFHVKAIEELTENNYKYVTANWSSEFKGRQ